MTANRTISTVRRDAAVKALDLDSTDLFVVTITPHQAIVQRLVRDTKGRIRADGDGNPIPAVETFDFYTP